METDALLLKQAVESQAWSLSSSDFLIKEIQELARLNLQSFHFRGYQDLVTK
jgi:hypothetical protein